MDVDSVESLGGRIANRGGQVRDGVAAKLNIGASVDSAGVFGQVAMRQTDQAIATARDGAEKAAVAAEDAGAKTKATAQATRATDQAASSSMRNIESQAARQAPSISGGSSGRSASALTGAPSANSPLARRLDNLGDAPAPSGHRRRCRASAATVNRRLHSYARSPRHPRPVPPPRRRT